MSIRVNVNQCLDGNSPIHVTRHFYLPSYRRKPISKDTSARVCATRLMPERYCIPFRNLLAGHITSAGRGLYPLPESFGRVSNPAMSLQSIIRLMGRDAIPAQTFGTGIQSPSRKGILPPLSKLRGCYFCIEYQLLTSCRAYPGHPGAVYTCGDGSQERFYRALSFKRDLPSKSIRLKSSLLVVALPGLRCEIVSKHAPIGKQRKGSDHERVCRI